MEDLTFDKAKRNLQQIRSKQIPKSPMTTAEVNAAFGKDYIMQHYGMTRRTNDADRTPFFKIAADEQDFSYCIFASDEIARLTHEKIKVEMRKFFSDGTFDSAPKGMYTQLLIVYTSIYGQVSHCLFAQKRFK